MRGRGGEGNRGCVIMLPGAREGQVDDGLAVFGLCTPHLTSPLPGLTLPSVFWQLPLQQFRCSDGCCIDSFLECDDTPDCPDASWGHL